MSLSVPIAAALGLFLCVNALTDDEIAQFASLGCAVTYGTCSGKYFYGSVSITKNENADTITLVANGIPDHATCSSSTSAGSTCYNDPLSSWLAEQDHNEVMPLNPTAATSATSLPQGGVGYAINGVSILSPYSQPCTDAVEDESIGFDDCLGHPQELGDYHYHAAPICLNGYLEAYENQSQFLVGVALDGFPIYSEWDANGEKVDNDDLDDCHGYYPEDGSGYRYIVNGQFPYIIGCFKGTPLSDVEPHCDGRRRLSAEAIERKDQKVASVFEAARRRLQPGGGGSSGGGSSGGSSTQEEDGCGEACSGNECGEASGIEICDTTVDCEAAGFCADDATGTTSGSAALRASLVAVLAVGVMAMVL